jgi:hypothetical protein
MENNMLVLPIENMESKNTLPEELLPENKGDERDALNSSLFYLFKIRDIILQTEGEIV